MAYPYQPYSPAPNVYNPMYQDRGPVQPYAPQPLAAAQANNGILWVQGQEGAKSYLVQPGSTVLLMDSEGSRFYIKSADNAGLPQLRTFEFTEVTGVPTKAAEPKPDYATKSEIDELRAKLEDLQAQIKPRPKAKTAEETEK